ncbi:MAG: transcription elongation factor GreA [Clostridia bacterium]|nr:transcription elongation factor GreA [Clostridia bacterium]
MADEIKLTQSGLDEIKAELKHLYTAGRNEVIDKIKEAKSFGDLSENSEYDEAKNDQSRLESRIAQLEYIVSHAEIIDESSLSVGIVSVGSTVTYRSRGKESTVQIVGAPQADPMNGKLSDASPVGKGLIGHKKGEVIKIETPAGIREIEILEISK